MKNMNKKSLFLIIIVFLASLLFISNVKAVAQDYTTYTEVDSSSVISIQSSTQIYANVQNRYVAYVYYDGGENAYGDFVATFSKQGAYLTANGICVYFMVANSINDAYHITQNNGYSLYCWSIGIDSNNVYFKLTENVGGTEYTDTSDSTYNMVGYHYITVTRNGDSLTEEIYSDSDRTTLLETLSLTLHDSDLAYQYVYAVSGYNNGGTYYNRNYMRDLNIEGVTPPDTYFISYVENSFNQNTTNILNTANFTSLFSTNSTLDYFIFSWNYTEVFINETALSFIGSMTENLIDLGENATKIGYTISVIIYANTTTGEVTNSGLQNFILTYPSGGGEYSDSDLEEMFISGGILSVLIISVFAMAFINDKKNRRK